MSREQTDLLPCPFCGGPAQLEPKNWAGRDWIGVFCVECGLFHDSRNPNDAEAIAAWNTRAALAPTVSGGEGWEELERLAQRCTSGDPWYKEGDLCGRQTFGQFLSQDRAFIAAANPEAVLALIAVARGGGLKAEYKQALTDCNRMRDDGSLPPASPTVPTGGKLESGDVLQGPVQQVAVRFGDITVTAPMPGFRHHHILTVASFFGHRHGEQGFATADGSFLTRKEAAQIALKSGQVTKLIAPPDLYSEDCW